MKKRFVKPLVDLRNPRYAKCLKDFETESSDSRPDLEYPEYSSSNDSSDSDEIYHEISPESSHQNIKILDKKGSMPLKPLVISDTDSEDEENEHVQKHNHKRCQVVKMKCPVCHEFCYKECEYKFHSLFHSKEDIIFNKLIKPCTLSELKNQLKNTGKKRCPGCSKSFINPRVMMVHYKNKHTSAFPNNR